MTLQRASSLLLTTVLVVFSAGCAHESARTTPENRDTDTVERKLLVLEGDFARFVGTRLDRGDDGERLTGPLALRVVEREQRRLESLRLAYLDAVKPGAAPRQRMIAMVRIGELHLDLSARIRRVPYGAGMDAAARAAFDDLLSRRALPLEATGLGVLGQAVSYAERTGEDGPFAARARIYLALHDGTAVHVVDDEVGLLRRELSAVGPYRAPRRLLEVGRVGQRAARR